MEWILFYLLHPSTRSPTKQPSTPAFPTQPSLHSCLLHTTIPPLHPSAHYNLICSPGHLPRPPPPSATPLNKCKLHPHVCIADVSTPPQVTLLQPPNPTPLHFIPLQTTFHSILFRSSLHHTVPPHFGRVRGVRSIPPIIAIM